MRDRRPSRRRRLLSHRPPPSERYAHGEDGGRKTIDEFYDITLFGTTAESSRETDKGDAMHISGHVGPNGCLRDGGEIPRPIGDRRSVHLWSW